MNVFNAEALRSARLSRRISQIDLGLKVGLSSATICRIERGERLPSAAEIEAFAKALESTVMKEVEIPERDVTVPTRLVGLGHRIKVEVSLEQISELVSEAAGRVTLNTTGRQQPALVFYVPLDGLSVDGMNEEEEDSTTQMRPRQR